MKIKRVECDQFAGIQGKEYSFENGLNLVIGNNESGKSTMVDLIFQMLFQDTKLDGRSDAAFIDRYFPKTVSGPQGDVIDGVLVFETPNGTYKIRKEWEKKGGSCRLTLPDGTSIKGTDSINELRDKELTYGKGIFSEIVFASQKRDQMAVENIMRSLSQKGASKDSSMKDLTATLSQASLETGGISIDLLESRLRDILDMLSFRWDLDADMPENGKKRGINNKWSIKQGNDGILKAYYDAEEVRALKHKASEIEDRIDVIKQDLNTERDKKKAAENDMAEFRKIRNVLEQSALISGAIDELKLKIRHAEDCASKWPELESAIKQANELKTRYEQAIIHEHYVKAAGLRTVCTKNEGALKDLKKVDPNDIKKAKALNKDLIKEESRLAGMDLVAKINRLGDAPVNVAAVANGSAIEGNNGEYSIKEAASITVPGVVEIQLMPKGVDAAEVKRNIEQLGKELGSIYSLYGVTGTEEMEDMASAYNAAVIAVDRSSADLERELSGESWEELEKANTAVPSDIESAGEINLRIKALCRSQSIDAFIGAQEAALESIRTEFASRDNILAVIDSSKDELSKKQEKLQILDTIPEKYRGIEDPDIYDNRLQSSIDMIDNSISALDKNLRENERLLGERSADEYADELAEKERIFEQKKTEYRHWKHIYEVFIRTKEKTGGVSVQDIEDKFREYLSVITDGNVVLTSIDEELSAKIASGKHALTYDILSDGTKDTVSLAFRLAMLEHLYPDGGGLAIFDDPFTDMDPGRVEQACRLISRFAENNQVIFVTCDNKYADMLNGNVIRV